MLIFTMSMTFRCTLPSDHSVSMVCLSCTDDVTRWFFENGLLLNPSKTEAVVLGTASRLRSLQISGGVKMAGTSLQWTAASSTVEGVALWRFYRLASAPAVWNNILDAVRDFVSVDTFKTAFKTRPFNCAYIPRHWQWSIGTLESLLVTYGAD